MLDYNPDNYIYNNTRMKCILILLVLLLIMIFLRLFITKEGFVSTPLKPETVDAYNKFLIFYNTFCTNWKKAIQSGVALELPQRPLTSPSQFNSASAPSISDEDMNLYITKLSQQLSQPLPPTCTTFPTSINSDSLPTIIDKIPRIEPFVNALNWMNQHMEKSQENLKSSVEGFDTCQNLSSCLSNNPELVKQIANEMSKQNVIEVSKLEDILVTKLMPFLNTPSLIGALNKNKTLIEKSQEIQAKAESGELMNNVATAQQPSTPEIKYTKPAGADKLINMKKADPDRYKEIEKSHGQWMSIKNLTDQINSTL